MSIKSTLTLALTLILISNASAKDILVINTDSGLNARVIENIKKGLNKTLELDESLNALNHIKKEDRIITVGVEPSAFNEFLPEFSDSPGRVVFGAYLKPSTSTGISLRVNTQKLLTSVSIVSPAIKTLKTVVTEHFDEHYLEKIRRQAASIGIVLDVHKASTPVELASKWEGIFTSIDSETAGVALIDTTYMKKIGGLRYILKTAWKKQTLVVTTVQSYSTRGVSVGIALDLVGYGEELAALLNSNATNQRFTESYSPALNLRHLNHIGIRVNTSELAPSVVFIE